MSAEVNKVRVCPVCHSTDISLFCEIRRVPIHCNVLWPTHDEAIDAPTGDIQLGFCEGCGHIYNFTFDPNLMEYTQNYENSLHFSPRFQSYATALAARLIERHHLHGKDIIEIGCGKGDFLTLLCELGENRGIGFDPSYEYQPGSSEPKAKVSFVQDFYSERYSEYQADLICCRHVLEHVEKPFEFLKALRRAIGNHTNTSVFFEVPNVLYTLRDLSIWDIIYEHCSYFSDSSLRQVFDISGFEVSELTESFEGQYLCIEAQSHGGFLNSSNAQRENVRELARDVSEFAAKYISKVEAWRSNLERIEREDQRVIVWGAGSKGVTFLNALNIRDQIKYIVDLNPRKEGAYVAGTGQRIVSPEFLKDYRPDVVIVMNAIYKDEIRIKTEELGLTVELLLA